MVKNIEVWLSLVERCVRDAEAAGSSPVTSTIFIHSYVLGVYFLLKKKPTAFAVGFFAINSFRL